MNRIGIALMALAIWTGLVFWAGSTFTGRGADLKASKKETAQATAVVDQVNQTRATEHTQAATMATIGAKHEEDRAAAPAVADAVVAGVRDGTLQLRNDLATCHTTVLSRAVAGAVERDAGAQLRAEVAADLVRIGRDADDQVRALQAVVAADRAEVIP
ncbi:lysis system i-spanin subunit Rz [Stenotrophomonas sp. SrG]|uniref:lysis system i-spanin subunit Rz n=1 Tax=Stenotrophomonas sp. SrG TaxID=3414430 RepID=UPI003CF77316